MAEEPTTPDAGGEPEGPPPEPGVVETEDGTQHGGVVPASAALPPVSGGTPRTGWYRSPSSYVAHADGPSQRRAFADRGWVEISEDKARELLASSVTLEVDRTDANGTFDADGVAKAVREEAPPQARTFAERSAAAKKAAETRRANRAAAKADADHLEPEG